MVTIAKYISDFINTHLSGVDIETNHLEDGADKYGLFKSPSRSVVEHTDGSYTVTEHYQFFARQAGISEVNRKDSDEFLEELTYWVDDYPFSYEYPEIDGGRRITQITLTGCPYPLEVEGSNEVVYQIALSVTYDRERSI